MLSVSIIHSSCLFGYEILNLFLPESMDKLDCAAIGTPFGFIIVTWIYYFLNKLRPLDNYTGKAVTFFIYIVSFILNYKHRKKRRQCRTLHGESVLMFIGTVLLYFIFCYISYLLDGVKTTGTVFSDIPFHLALISSFSYGFNHNTTHFKTPFYGNETLKYSIVPDFFSSILVSSGNASMRTSIAVPTFLVMISITIAFFSLFKYFSKIRFVSEVAIIFWFFAGGTGWKWWFNPECRTKATNFIGNFCEKKSTFWIHPFIHFLMPQRSANFSLAIDIYIILLLNTIVDTKYRDRRVALVTGILMGILPMVSAHSFIAVGEYAIFLCLFNFNWKQPKLWIHDIITWACYGVVAMIIAIPQIYYLIGSNKREIFHLKPIWYEEGLKGFSGMLHMWWDSLGGFVIIALFFVWPILGSKQRRIYLPSIFVFIISNFVNYQKVSFDNTKIFLVAWYPLACACVGQFFVINFIAKASNTYIKVVFIFALVLICFSGFLCVVKSSQQDTLFTLRQGDFGIYFAQYAEQNTSILAPSIHKNELMALGGQKIYIGYDGWVYSHGFDINSAIEEREYLFDNLNQTYEFEKRNIKYLYYDTAIMTKSPKKTERPRIQDPWIIIGYIDNIIVYKLLDDFYQ